MAFNLSKNDEATKIKFDLSKSDDSTPDLKEPKNNNKTILIIVIIAVAIVAIYFLTRNSKPEETSTTIVTDTTSMVSNMDTASAISDTSSATSTVVPQIDAPANFAKGSAEVNSVDDTKLNQIIEYVKSNSSAVVTIEGYASSEGELDFNLKLSESRASNFAQYLISKGVKIENLKTVGKGIENPIASNDDESGRSQNRRVEIKF